MPVLSWHSAHTQSRPNQGRGLPRFRVSFPSSINSVNISQPGTAAHTFKPSTLRQRQSEFEANLVNTGVPGQPGLYIKTCLKRKDEKTEGNRERGREERKEGDRKNSGKRALRPTPSGQLLLDETVFPDDSRLYQRTVKTAHHTLQLILVLKAEYILKNTS